MPMLTQPMSMVVTVTIQMKVLRRTNPSTLRGRGGVLGEKSLCNSGGGRGDTNLCVIVVVVVVGVIQISV